MAEQPLPPRAELLIFGVRRRRRKNCLVDAETKTGSDTKLAGLLPGPMPLGLTWCGGRQGDLVWRGDVMHCFIRSNRANCDRNDLVAVHEICGSRNVKKEGINQTLNSHI